MRIFYLTLFCFASSFSVLYGQTSDIAVPIDTVLADFQVSTADGVTQFEPILPELKGIPGGRQPFYTYLWDFGDGHFSVQEKPTHHYNKPGNYQANLYVVNNYDDGPRPKRRAKGVRVDSAKRVALAPSPVEEHFFGSNGVFQLFKNANALPGQDMVIVAGIKHQGKGRVFLLTNEKAYGAEGLKYAGQSRYNDEKMVTEPMNTDAMQSLWATISKVMVTYSGSPDYGIKEEQSFEAGKAVDYFSALYGDYQTITQYEVESESDEPQFSFINLDVTPEMLADTNAIVTITGVYVPDNGEAMVHKLEVPVVTSHDPNKMSLKQSRLSYRTVAKKKELIYKVQFQNDGEGDAKNVTLEMLLPEQVDPTTFQLLSLYPACDSCATATDRGCWRQFMKGTDTLVFHFKDISLPGTKAADITDQDSTKGFIRFSVKTRKKLENKPFRAQTKIVFDQNEPIVTNRATGRFRKGISPIIFAGYGGFIASPKDRTGKFQELGQLGIGIAPIAPYRKLYWQLELYASPSRYKEAVYDIPERGHVPVEMVDKDGQVRQTEVYYDRYHRVRRSDELNLRIVPLHIRYNFNSFLAAGIGGMMEGRISMDNNEERIYIPLETMFDPVHVDQGAWDELGNKWSAKAFVDVTAGRVYFGPSIGFRYAYGASRGQQWHVYLAWRL